MVGEKRILGEDSPDETPSRPAIRAKKPEKPSRAEAVIKEEDSLEEIVVQCPPISTSRFCNTIQRASTLPAQQSSKSSNNPVQRSRTAPTLDSPSIPSTPKKSARGEKPLTSNVSRSRVISISADECTTDEETIPSSPATNVSTTLSPTLGLHLPSYSSPVRPGDQGDGGQKRPRCCRSGMCGDHHNHRTPTSRSLRGSKSPSSSKKATNPRTPVQSTNQRGTSYQRQPAKKVVWNSSSSAHRPPLIHSDTLDPTLHPPREHSESRLPPSSGGSSRLTYISDEGRPDSLAHLTCDSDYYTPSSRNSEMSDTDSEPPRRRKGKRRASPPPSSQNHGSSVRESHFSPSLSVDSSPPNPSSVSSPSHKKRRDRYFHPPSPENGVNYQEQTEPQDLGRDVCHCMGPCPSCHKPRFLPPPQTHPFMFQPGYYPYLYFPPSHIQSGYHLTNYGPSPYPYPYMIPQQSDPIASISSAQFPPPPSGCPMPPVIATHPLTVNPNSSTYVTPAPAPTPSTPAPALSTPVPIPSSAVEPLLVGPSATKQVPPELLEALDQFYQPPQRSVKVIDPSCDPRSPYSKKANVPAFPNR